MKIFSYYTKYSPGQQPEKIKLEISLFSPTQTHTITQVMANLKQPEFMNVLFPSFETTSSS